MAAITPPGTRGPLVSIEGVSGVGKTHLTRLLARDPAITAIEAFSERALTGTGPARLGDQLLRALTAEAHGEHFLRAGHPGTETVLLLAVKAFDYEQSLPMLAQGRAVIEGRSLDSTAVYQSLIICPHDVDRAHAEAKAVLAIAARWRPLPDLTILITDDVATATGRAEQRDGRRFTAEQVSIHHRAAELFTRLAAGFPDRFRVIDRRETSMDSAAVRCAAWIAERRDRLGTGAAAS